MERIGAGMSKKYQVVEQMWNYDGECFQPGNTIVRCTHSTKAEAEKARLGIEKVFWFGTDLNQVSDFFDEKANVRKADRFLREKLGLSFDDIGRLPKTLSDTELLGFLKATGAKTAWVIPVDMDKPYYVLKFSDVDVYMRRAIEAWEGPTNLDNIVKANDLASLIKQSKWSIRANLELLQNHETSGRDLILKGSFHDLSDRPDELEKVWRKYKQIRFIKKDVQLLVNSGSADAIFALNDVLKDPLFSIEKLTFEEIEKMEASEIKQAKRIKKSDPGYADKIKWLGRLPGIRLY